MAEQQTDGARKAVESTAALYFARLGTPILLAVIGTLVFSAWGDLKKVGEKLTDGLSLTNERIHVLDGKINTETQVRALSDEEIKRRLRDLERTGRAP